MKQLGTFQWDVFISHASEDKEPFVRSLASELGKEVKVWYDDFTLRVGDSLRQSIDKGLAQSRYGIVVLSHNFFTKNWPQRELDGLVSRERDGAKVILPIWLDVDVEDVRQYSPMLADRWAALASEGLPAVVAKLLAVLKGNAEGSSSTPASPPRARSPRLKIEFAPTIPRLLGPIWFPDGSVRRFACVNVTKVSGPTAVGCWATLQLLRWPLSFRPQQPKFKLHWADTDYTFQSDTAEPVNIDTSRYLDVAFALLDASGPTAAPVITSGGAQLHADQPSSPGAAWPSGPGTAEYRLPKTPALQSPVPHLDHPAREARPKRVAFDRPRKREGCWIAIPLALSRPDLAGQAYLVPGRYHVKLDVGDDSGDSDSMCFNLTSPSSRLDLNLEVDSSPHS